MTAAHTWIQTFTGGDFDILDPDPAKITIEDVAHHLALLNRYTGATRLPYSVAQHSVIVSRIVPSRLALAGLLHDAEEAYVNDLSSPMKRLIRAEAPGLIERVHGAVRRAVETRFGVSFDDPEIKRADLIALATEKRDLLTECKRPGWGLSACAELPEPLWFTLEPWGWRKAEEYFLSRYHELT